MKRCVMCRQLVPLTSYNVRRASPDGLQNVCRACNRAQARRYYARSREAHIGVVMARKAKTRQIVLEAVGRYLLSHPCVDCGESDIRVLDFDHRYSRGKEAEVMRLAQHGHSFTRVMAEIAKCDVRCRNCHAKVTYERLGENWRSALMRRVIAEASASRAAEEPEGPGAAGAGAA